MGALRACLRGDIGHATACSEVPMATVNENPSQPRRRPGPPVREDPDVDEAYRSEYSLGNVVRSRRTEPGSDRVWQQLAQSLSNERLQTRDRRGRQRDCGSKGRGTNLRDSGCFVTWRWTEEDRLLDLLVDRGESTSA